jgi:hypothetical protein
MKNPHRPMGWLLLATLATGSLPGTLSADDSSAATESTLFPTGVLFEPLIADPKQPRSYVTLQSFDTEVREEFTAAVVAFGDTFGLGRWSRRDGVSAWQLNIDGAVFAQFDMDSSSEDLLNADYMVGLGTTYQRGRHGVRLRLYHQSSHLGDEFILNNPDLPFERVNFSYESLQLIYAHSWETWRFYAGGELPVNWNPRDVQLGTLQAGIEYRGRQRDGTRLRPIGGLDVRSIEQNDWEPSVSIKLGLELFAEDGPTKRRLRILIEAYDGFVPFGQFYDFELTSFGAGLYFGF